MPEFINTVDVLGDEAVVDSIIDRSIKELKDNTIKTVSYGVFFGCTALENVDLPVAQSIGGQSLRQCSRLQSVIFPSVQTVGEYALYNCGNLKKADFYAVTRIGSYAFGYGYGLETLILRTDTVCALANTEALLRTLIAGGYGYIYVPAALKTQYQQATNWSTYAARFRALEDYTVDGTIWGDLDENKI